MKHTEKFLKQRKFYLILPFLVLPFITLMFWALGGGKDSTVQAMPSNTGLNAELPDAQFEPDTEKDLWDKLTLYESAARDSAAHETARENDPYFDLSFQSKPKEDQSKLIGTFKRRDRVTDPNEIKVNSKLEELYREISRASDPDGEKDQESFGNANAAQGADTQFTEDVSRLESMMEQIQLESGSIGRTEKDLTEDDPEMAGINSVLDKLMDVQHPERVRERMNANKPVSKNPAFTVTAIGEQPLETFSARQSMPVNDSTFRVDANANDFFGLEEQTEQTIAGSNTIPAIIHETQTVVSGSTVRLRLLQDITINNVVIAKDQFIYGTCSIDGERLLVEVTSILSGQTLLPVSLSVYDLSGLEGIFIPGAMSRDAAKQASDDALQNVQLMSLDQSLGTQAASVGIEATKGLLSRKAKLVKITVKAGYQVVLRNKTEQ